MTRSREDDSAKREVTKHLFSNLRGKPNLVFAGSRQNVEWYADALREMSEKAKVPVDFLPHHANLSREHRTDLEKSLKTRRTTTAICTSTLELGIDIGDIECVAQIGPPFSVASLRPKARTFRKATRAACRVANVCDRARSAGGLPPVGAPSPGFGPLDRHGGVC